MPRLHPALFALALLAAGAVVQGGPFPVATAQPAGVKPFTPAALAAAQQAGGPILVEVTAPWCPTCKAQKPILSTLLGKAKFAGMTVLNVDFDSQKDALKQLGVRMQSTLISFKGAKEVGRSTGTTDATAIEDQLNKSI